MKGIYKAIFILQALFFIGLAQGSLSAQTYSGYLKATGDGVKGVDSLYVTITVPSYSGGASVNVASEKSKYVYTGKGYYTTPWLAGVKTNLLADLISIPYAGVEIQLADKFSLDISGWFSPWNVFYPNEQTSLYGAAPEVRWWFGNSQIMKKGHFLGLHGMAAWYTLEWKDRYGSKVIYQNGTSDLNDTGSTTPAWSCGITYGYSLPLDRKGRLGLEFYIGAGYSHYQQKCIYPQENAVARITHEVKDRVGVTKVGVNLAYRFSLRPVKEM
jgi:hypothetical protein